MTIYLSHANSTSLVTYSPSWSFVVNAVAKRFILTCDFWEIFVYRVEIACVWTGSVCIGGSQRWTSDRRKQTEKHRTQARTSKDLLLLIGLNTLWFCSFHNSSTCWGMSNRGMIPWGNSSSSNCSNGLDYEPAWYLGIQLAIARVNFGHWWTCWTLGDHLRLVPACLNRLSQRVGGSHEHMKHVYKGFLESDCPWQSSRVVSKPTTEICTTCDRAFLAVPKTLINCLGSANSKVSNRMFVDWHSHPTPTPTCDAGTMQEQLQRQHLWRFW